MPNAREELNRSVRERKIATRHSFNSFDGMGSRSHDLGAELRMHFFTVDCDTFFNVENVAVVVPVTCVVVSGSEAMLALSVIILVIWFKHRFLDAEVDGLISGISMLCPWARHFIRIASVDSAVK